MAGSSLDAPPAKRLEGKLAVITGGATGIGATTAKLFVRHGAKVVIADVQDNLGQTLVQNLVTPGNYNNINRSAAFIHCDVTSESHVQNAVDFAIQKFGQPLDIMFSNAGVYGHPVAGILEVNHEIIKRVFDVNVFGAFYSAKHASRVMIPEKKGCIIFNASAASVTYSDIPHTYCASKNAVVGLAKNLGVELGQHGIRVNCVSPYVVGTDLSLKAMGLGEGEGGRAVVEGVALEAANLKGKVLDEEDVAKAALFLASDDAAYISGLNLVVDGGFSTTNRAYAEAIKKLHKRCSSSNWPK